MKIRTVSYGGGVQSTSLLVLAAQGKIDFRTFLMSNVGDDSEHPATLEYVRNVAVPYAAENGIDLRILERVNGRSGKPETLMERMLDPDYKALPIPVRLAADGPPVSRTCTVKWKLDVVGGWLKEQGAHGGKRCKAHRAEDWTEEGCFDGHNRRCTKSTASTNLTSEVRHNCDRGPREGCTECLAPNRAVVALGISLDEIHRANRSKARPYEDLVYPLISDGEDTGLMMRRRDCERVIRSAGLPVPPKSSCFFCPYHSNEGWRTMRRDEPDLFDKAASLEEHLTSTRAERGQGPVFLSSAGIPLRDAVNTDQASLFADDCDSGVCFT